MRTMSTAGERRVKRELKTVGSMIELYCRSSHGAKRCLCADCAELWGYTQQRMTHCRLLADKPTCRHCPVHCYEPAMRERIKAVMRYSGPRMLWMHPILTVLHLADGWRDRRRASIVSRLASRSRAE